MSRSISNSASMRLTTSISHGPSTSPPCCFSALLRRSQRFALRRDGSERSRKRGRKRIGSTWHAGDADTTPPAMRTKIRNMSRLVARLSRGLWTPRVLRYAPVNAFQQIAELSRRDRDGVPRCRRPDEAATLQPLGVKAHALAVVPQNLDQPTTARFIVHPSVRFREVE